MYGVIETIADCRRQDMLTIAARERPANEARPDQPHALLSQEVLWNAVRIVCASSRSALDACSLTLRPRSLKREHTMLTGAR